MKALEYVKRILDLVETVGNVDIVIGKGFNENEFELAGVECQNVTPTIFVGGQHGFITSDYKNTETVIKVY